MKNIYFSLLPVTATLTFGITLFNGLPISASNPIFSCQSNQGILTTVATNNNGLTQPVFHWNRNHVDSFTHPQQLCDSVSLKLNKYLANGHDLSSLTFQAQEQMGLPAICVAEQDKPCRLLLFTLEPSLKPYLSAHDTLASILDQNLQTIPIKYQDRGLQSTAYKVNFWQLLGWK